MTETLAHQTIEQLAPLIKTKEISPVEVTTAVLQEVEKKNPLINAYIDIYKEEALDVARLKEAEIMKGIYHGALHGIPLALKDIFHMKNKRVTFGSKIHGDHIANYDATVVEKLKQAGAIFTGTLNMHEYASGNTTNNAHYGACRNPWDPERIPGGSSGGSAAAVAANMTIASLGTDTGGSIRGPASVCGIVGLKPTYGRVSKHGCFPLAWSLDHIGPMTKTVTDTAILLQLLAGYDSRDSASSNYPVDDYTSNLTGDIQGLVIGISEEYFFDDVDPEVEKIVRTGIQKLEQLGAKIEQVKIPSLENTIWAQRMTITAESAAVHHQHLIERPADFAEDVRQGFELGHLISAVDYLQAQQIRALMKKEFNNVFEKVDVLISPTHPFPATVIGQDKKMHNGREIKVYDNVSRFSRPGNLVGLPSLSIPCGIHEGLPVGMQITGAAFAEKTVLQFAKAVEDLNLLQEAKPKVY